MINKPTSFGVYENTVNIAEATIGTREASRSRVTSYALVVAGFAGDRGAFFLGAHAAWYAGRRVCHGGRAACTISQCLKLGAVRTVRSLRRRSDDDAVCGAGGGNVLQ